jgi:holo-[acyl-carrier protein] synthase
MGNSTSRSQLLKLATADMCENCCANCLVGIGVDLLEVDRIKKSIQSSPRFLSKVFSQIEQDYCLRKANPYPHFAARYAAKEAFFKSLGLGKRGLKFAEVSVVNDALGKPQLRVEGSAQQLVVGKKISKLYLSIAHEASLAIAWVIACR